MIDQRAAALERQLDAERSSGNSTAAATVTAIGTTNSSGTGTGGRGQMAVQFFEKRRRKAWLSRGDDEVCWECWTVKVTVAEPRTESGTFVNLGYPLDQSCVSRYTCTMRKGYLTNKTTMQNVPKCVVPWSRPSSLPP